MPYVQFVEGARWGAKRRRQERQRQAAV